LVSILSRDHRERFSEFFSNVLKAVERGETVVVSYRGKAKARIVPLSSSKATGLRTGEAFGLWKDRKDMGDVSAYVMKLRRPRFRDR
jgi:prevent-host-death family protein